MDHPVCNVVYVDRRALTERLVRSGDPDAIGPSRLERGAVSILDEQDEIRDNLRTLLHLFKGVYVCKTGLSCITKLRELDAVASDSTPTLIFLHVLAEGDSSYPFASPAAPSREQPPTPLPTSPGRKRPHSSGAQITDVAPEDFYGFALLQYIVGEIDDSRFSNLLVPIAVMQMHETAAAAASSLQQLPPPTVQFGKQSQAIFPPEQGLLHPSNPRFLPTGVELQHMKKCVELGAIDAIVSPMTAARVEGFITHAYRAHVKGLRQQATFLSSRHERKRSWVGIDEEKPYAYLRESMVSTLMNSICKPESLLHVATPMTRLYNISERQEAKIAQAIGTWAFSAHDFSEDELVHAAYLILQHALQMDELEKWRIPADELKMFLMACRSAYNSFVLYHNFRHVVDVLQAVFFFLLQLGTLPPYPSQTALPSRSADHSPAAALLKPFDAFVLLVSAIGHDVGHPGVNNAFLVALKAPLAQLYNDNSVLEAFHCAAYSQILRRYWNSTFEDTELRRLLIKSILATDMQMHFKYMTDLGNLQEKLHHNKGTDGWSPQVLEEYKTLACGLLIKCADISNVARPFGIAAKWSDVLQLEFARQGQMEKDVGIPTTLFGGPPELGNMTKLANSQLGFMNIFASPLFESVSDVMPGMLFAVDEIERNKIIWTNKIEAEKTNDGSKLEHERYNDEGLHSPRSGSPDRSFAASPQASHPEGLPASGSDPQIPTIIPLITSQAPLDFKHRHSSLDSGLGRSSDTALLPAPSQPSTRTSSPGHPIIPNASSHPDLYDYSRRSSSAYPQANIHSSGNGRSSGNATSTQMGLGMTPDFNSTPPPPVPPLNGIENTAPNHQLPQATFPSSSYREASYRAGGSVNGSTRENGSASSSAGAGGSGSGSGGGGSSFRGDKSDSDAPFLFHNYPVSNHNCSHAPYSSNSTQYSPYNNYSRPMSTHHSAQASYALSSAPSGTPTFVSSANLPTSPTETQATSFFTDGDGSDTGMDSLPEPFDLEQPGSGARFCNSTNASGSLGMRSGELVKTAVSDGSGTNGNSNSMLSSTSAINGLHSSNERVVRRKGSRFRFWKRKKSGEGTSP